VFGSNETEAQEQASSDEKGPGLPALRRPDHEESEMRAGGGSCQTGKTTSTF